jgi:hypothetical protein
MEKITIPKFEIKTETEAKKEENSVQKIDNQENNTSEVAKAQPKYRGVSFHRKNKKWIAQATNNGKSKYLGTHDTAERAARVYDAYVLTIIGASAKTNFPKEELDLTLLPKLRSYKKEQTNKMPLFFPQNPLFSMSYPQQTFPGRKDPRHPKHARNSFVMYVAERRRIIKEEGLKRPGNGKGNMLNIFSEEWKVLPEIERLKFKQLAEEDRRRYESEMQNYEDPSVFSYLQNEMINPFQMMTRGPNVNNGFPSPGGMIGLDVPPEAGRSSLEKIPVTGNATPIDVNEVSMNRRDEEGEKKEFSDDANSNDEEGKKQLLITPPQISLHKEDENKRMPVESKNVVNYEDSYFKIPQYSPYQNSPVTQDNQDNQERQNTNMNVQLKNTFENDDISFEVGKNKLKDKCVQKWTLSDALQFLAEHDLKMYEKLFMENCIDGEVLYSIDREQCEALGIKTFHAPKILRLLQNYAM